MQKIDFKNLPDTTTPLNASNLNAIQNNAETAINANTTAITTLDTKVDRNATYSTSEIVIGIYNGKPLYRNEIKFTTVAGAKSVSIPNLDKLINLSGSIRGQGNQFPPNIYVSSSYEFHTWVNGTNLWTNCTGYVGYEADLFLEYTKTTD